ncbi:MAG: hypothetical protein ACM3TU_03660 [Bacillota bacterium]
MIKRLVAIFLLAFGTNYIWEHLHSVLYAHYKGGPITEFILARATLADAVLITLISMPFLLRERLAKRSWLIIIIGIVVSIGIEEHALTTGRWAYTAVMPVIPLLHTGLTPTIQIGLLGYFCYLLTVRIFKQSE